KAMIFLAVALQHRGEQRFADAVSSCRSAEEIAAGLVKDFPERIAFRVSLLQIRLNLGPMLAMDQKTKEAEKVLKDAIDSATEWEKQAAPPAGDALTTAVFRRCVADAWDTYGKGLLRRGASADAVPALQQASGRYDEVVDRFPGDLAFRRRW